MKINRKINSRAISCGFSSRKSPSFSSKTTEFRAGFLPSCSLGLAHTICTYSGSSLSITTTSTWFKPSNLFPLTSNNSSPASNRPFFPTGPSGKIDLQLSGFVEHPLQFLLIPTFMVFATEFRTEIRHREQHGMSKGGFTQYLFFVHFSPCLLLHQKICTVSSACLIEYMFISAISRLL